MEEIWVINPPRHMALPCHPLIIKDNSYGSLRLLMSNLKVAMDTLLGTIGARVESKIVVVTPAVVGTSTLAGTSPNDEK